MDHIDHLAARVTATAMTGLFLGASLATFRGIPIPKTSLSVATSCALTGTACFTSERVAHYAINALVPTSSPTVTIEQQQQQQQQQQDSNSTTSYTNTQKRDLLFVSHALGGVIGGSICGGLFQRKPWGGMLLFTPLMLGVALMEMQFDELKRERIQSILKEANHRSDIE